MKKNKLIEEIKYCYARSTYGRVLDEEIKYPRNVFSNNIMDMSVGYIIGSAANLIPGFFGLAITNSFNVPENVRNTYIVAALALPILTNTASGVYEIARGTRRDRNALEVKE